MDKVKKGAYELGKYQGKFSKKDAEIQELRRGSQGKIERENYTILSAEMKKQDKGQQF